MHYKNSPNVVNVFNNIYECNTLFERETHEIVYSVDKMIKDWLPWKQNVVIQKWDPNLGDFRYCHVTLMYPVIHYLTFHLQITNNISKGTNVNSVT